MTTIELFPLQNKTEMNSTAVIADEFHNSVGYKTRTTWGPGRSADLATSSLITFSQQFCFLASYQCRNSQDNFITNQRISTYVIARHIFDKIISSKGISLFWKFSEKSQFWMPKIGVPEASHTIP